MYKLTACNTEYSCEEKPLKTSDTIKGIGKTTITTYNHETEKTAEAITVMPFKFSGITDFSGYILTDLKGNPVDFAVEVAEDENLLTQLAIAEVYEKQLAQDEDILTTQLAVAEIYELLR